jgi:hypothetical protein
MKRFWDKVKKTDGCWNWVPGNERYGKLKATGSRKNVLAHRMSWEMHNGPIPDEMHVLHTCDNTRCVRPDHLFLGTHQDNMDDKVVKGRQATGQAGAERRFDYDEIRSYIRQGCRQVDVALFMGCSERTVRNALVQ